MLEISQVSKTFFPNTVNERRALQGIDLHLAEGDFVTVIGSNGAGKSTILNTIAGKLLPDTGTPAPHTGPLVARQAPASMVLPAADPLATLEEDPDMFLWLASIEAQPVAME